MANLQSAIERLRGASAGREVIDQRTGKVVSCSFAEVSCDDILTACSAVKSPSIRVCDLRDGSNGAAVGATVHVKVTDLVHLIEQFANGKQKLPFAPPVSEIAEPFHVQHDD